MPTYEYQCRKCGRKLEKFQNITAQPLRKCPACGGAIRRLIGAGAAVLVKGGRSGAASPRVPPCGRNRPCDSCPMDE